MPADSTVKVALPGSHVHISICILMFVSSEPWKAYLGKCANEIFVSSHMLFWFMKFKEQLKTHIFYNL